MKESELRDIMEVKDGSLLLNFGIDVCQSVVIDVWPCHHTDHRLNWRIARGNEQLCSGQDHVAFVEPLREGVRTLL